MNNFFLKGISKNIFLENEFALMNDVGQGGFGRVFKMKHLKTGIMIAVKERVKEEQMYVSAWKEDINILKISKKEFLILQQADLLEFWMIQSQNQEKNTY